jgi:glyoxylase-like metal-dependent hydrolase (beta-lactamase superfamily II)
MPKTPDNVHVRTNFRGCNSSFVVTGDGVVVIDTPPVPSEARNWRDEARSYGEIRYVINNEPHNDHVAGNCWFGGLVVAQEGTRRMMLEARQEDLETMLNWMAPEALPLDKDFRWRLPDITFTQELTLYVGDHTFHITTVPGHTPFETAVYIPEEKVVFTSDNVALVEGAPIMFQCVPDAWLESLKRLQRLDVDTVVPGHGNIGDKGSFQVMHDNVKYCVEAVKAAIKKGWSLEEARTRVTFAERLPLPPGDPMARMRHMGIARLYEVLKK